MSSHQDNFANLVCQDILVIGSLVSDISCTFVRRPEEAEDARPREGSSNPAKITQCVGGVAHNIALATHYGGGQVLLVSVIANDDAGAFLLSELTKEGLKTEGIWLLQSSSEHGEVRTGQYVGNYNHDKEFLFGMADVQLMKHPELENASTWEKLIDKTRPKIIILDTTFSQKTIGIILRLALRRGARVVVEPVSQPRAKDLSLSEVFRETLPSAHQARVDMITPNTGELDALFEGAVEAGIVGRQVVAKALAAEERWLSAVTNISIENLQLLKSRLYKIVLLLHYVPVIVVTLGADGCLLTVAQDSGAVHDSVPTSAEFVIFESSIGVTKAIFEYFPSPCKLEQSGIVSVNGAGDSLIGAMAVEWVKLLGEDGGDSGSQWYPSVAWSDWRRIVDRGQWAAIATVQHETTVNPAIQDLEGLKEHMLERR